MTFPQWNFSEVALLEIVMKKTVDHISSEWQLFHIFPKYLTTLVKWGFKSKTKKQLFPASPRNKNMKQLVNKVFSHFKCSNRKRDIYLLFLIS